MISKLFEPKLNKLSLKLSVNARMGLLLLVQVLTVMHQKLVWTLMNAEALTFVQNKRSAITDLEDTIAFVIRDMKEMVSIATEYLHDLMQQRLSTARLLAKTVPKTLIARKAFAFVNQVLSEMDKTAK